MSWKIKIIWVHSSMVDYCLTSIYKGLIPLSVEKKKFLGLKNPPDEATTCSISLPKDFYGTFHSSLSTTKGYSLNSHHFASFCVCVGVHVGVPMYVPVCGCAHVCACAEGYRWKSGVVFNSLPPYFLIRVFHWSWSSQIWLSWLTNELQGSAPLCY